MNLKHRLALLLAASILAGIGAAVLTSPSVNTGVSSDPEVA